MKKLISMITVASTLGTSLMGGAPALANNDVEPNTDENISDVQTDETADVVLVSHERFFGTGGGYIDHEVYDRNTFSLDSIQCEEFEDHPFVRREVKEDVTIDGIHYDYVVTDWYQYNFNVTIKYVDSNGNVLDEIAVRKVADDIYPEAQRLINENQRRELTKSE